MSLANYDVKQQLINRFLAYLTTTAIPFGELQALLTNKKPVSLIHNSMVEELTRIKIADLRDIQLNSEEKACRQQIDEDDKERVSDQDEMRKDTLRRADLTNELRVLSQRKERLETDLRIRQLVQIPTPVVVQAPTNVHTHDATPTNVHTHDATPTNVHTHDATPTNVHTHDDEHAIRQKIQREIDSLNNRMSAIERELGSLDIKNNDRALRNQTRESRLRANLNYFNTKQNVEFCLSPQNYKSLSSSIDGARRILESKCSLLAQQAEQLNYSVFLEVAENSIDSLKSAPQDINALRAVIKIMKQHHEHEKQTAVHQAKFDAITQTVKDNKDLLGRHYNRLRSLQSSNPELTQENSRLEDQNRELQIQREKNIKSRSGLFYPTLISGGISLVAAIPLILTLAGVLSFVMTPLVLAALIAPPALLLAATLGCGIAALVYSIKASRNGSNIENNSNAIKNNSARMSQNIQEAETLRTQTIPALELKSATDELTQTGFRTSLKQSQTLAEQTLQQAKAINPVTHSSTAFLASGNVHQHPSVKVDPTINPTAPEDQTAFRM